MKGGSPPLLVIGRWVFGGIAVLLLLCLVAEAVTGNQRAAIESLTGLPIACLLYGITFVSGLFPKNP